MVTIINIAFQENKTMVAAIGLGQMIINNFCLSIIVGFNCSIETLVSK